MATVNLIGSLIEEILFGFPRKTQNKEIHEIWSWISYLRSTLRMDFSAMKVVYGFHVYRQIRIPDFKIKIQIRNS